jgi:type I restriction enzyme S subunit
MIQQIQVKQLPKGWKEEEIAKVAKKDKHAIVDGPFGSQMKVHEFVSEGIPLIEMQNLKRDKFEYNFRRFITKKKIEEVKRSRIKPFDLIISKTGTLGLVAIVPEDLGEAIITSRLAKFSLDKEKIDLDYVYYYLILLREMGYWQKIAKGTTMKILTTTQLKSTKITYPQSKKLQSLIVSAIETQFTRLDAAVKSLKSVKQKLEVYRKAVLNKAFEKKEGWEESKVGEEFSTNPPKSEINDLSDNLEVSFVTMKYVSEYSKKIINQETKKLSQVRKGYTYFKENDVILAKITPCFENGKMAIAKNLINTVGFGSTEFHVFRVKESLIGDYLFYFLQQDKFRSEAKRNMTGTAGQLRIPIKFIENYLIHFPKSKEEQFSIVKSIKSKFSVIDKVEEIVHNSLKKSEQLKKSILKIAFEGRLVEEKND